MASELYEREHMFKNDKWPTSQTGGNFNLTLWESKNYLTAQFSSKTITIYTVDVFFSFSYIMELFSVFAVRDKTEEK